MKNKIKVEFKHYGWFFVCPMIYGRDEFGCPYRVGRYGFNWLFILLERIYIIFINTIGTFNRNYTPAYRHIATGELKKPFFKYIEIEE